MSDDEDQHSNADVGSVLTVINEVTPSTLPFGTQPLFPTRQTSLAQSVRPEMGQSVRTGTSVRQGMAEPIHFGQSVRPGASDQPDLAQSVRLDYGQSVRSTASRFVWPRDNSTDFRPERVISDTASVKRLWIRCMNNCGNCAK